MESYICNNIIWRDNVYNITKLNKNNMSEVKEDLM